MPRKMKAAMFLDVGKIRYEETDLPMIGPGEVLIKIGTALTCGTDVKTYKRGHPILLQNAPSLFGHEYAGTIEEVGEGVKGFHVMAIEWEDKVPEIVERGGLYPRPKI